MYIIPVSDSLRRFHLIGDLCNMVKANHYIFNLSTSKLSQRYHTEFARKAASNS